MLSHAEMKWCKIYCFWAFHSKFPQI